MFKKPFMICAMAVWLASSCQAVFAVADPTKPPGYGGGQAKKIRFHLNSLLISDARKVAIINGQSVVVGDRISGAKVISISHQVVKLSQNGKVIELKPKRASVRREK